MKNSFWIGVGLASVGAFFLSAGTILVNEVTPAPLPVKELTIAMRQIGHQILLHAGDSSSRVLPVRQADQTFQIQFESPFTFIPDSLVKIVDRELSNSTSNLSYTVNMLECLSKDIIYGFRIGKLEMTTVVPCLGREQPVKCYLLDIAFHKKQKSIFENSYLLVIALASLSVVAFVGRTFSRKDKSTKEPVNFIQIGSYQFFQNKRELKHSDELIDLSEKEGRLLEIFTSHINQPVSREQLMKEVWNDEGVLVSRSLDVFVSKLRKKLKHDPTIQLVSIHGIGYKLLIE